jgi:hypothetical protein
VGKPEGKRPPGRPERRWVDSIKVHLGDIGWGGVDCILESVHGAVCCFLGEV